MEIKGKIQDRELFDGIFTCIEYLSLISLVSSVCKRNGRAAGPLYTEKYRDEINLSPSCHGVLRSISNVQSL